MEDLTSPRVLRETLARYGLAPRKSLGQSFLIDANLREVIVAAASLDPGDLVIEVGPGPGALTAGLLASGASVLAIETDPGLARVLADHLPPAPGRMSIIVGDFLRVDLRRAVLEAGFGGRPCLAVANLPYCITTPVFFRLLETDLPWRRMVLLVQREVAERIAASPGTKEYGLLSVMSQYRGRVEIVRIFPPSVFWPPPKVHSALLRLDLAGLPRLPGPEESCLFGLARAAFGQRRKTLQNACREWAARLSLAEEFAALCASANVNPACRGEELSIGDFVRLAVMAADRLAAKKGAGDAVH